MSEETPIEGQAPQGFMPILNLPEFYSSALRVMTSIYGTDILFGRTCPVDVEDERVARISSCVVHMSVAQAKSLVLLLRHQLRGYEKEWGTIPIPRELVEMYGGLDG